MGKYTVTTGQNLYDIAIHLYGSIEGIVDLMIQNPELSLQDRLKAGDVLLFTDDFTINTDIIAYNKMHMITPAAGERHVYHKEPGLPRIMEFHLPSSRTSAGITFTGHGELEIDWGDNTDLQKLILTEKQTNIYHNFDSAIALKRKIRLYGTDLLFESLDTSALQPDSVFFIRPVHVENFIFKKAHTNIGFLSLLKNTYEMDLSEIATSDLKPLLKNKRLMKLNLCGSYLKAAILDGYFKGLVNEYENRRNCHITLTSYPSGIYREPDRDENGNYILSTGMEAVWLLTHEPSWNEAGYWKIQINNDIYTPNHEQNYK